MAADAPLDDHDCTVGWADAVARWKPDVAVVVLAGQVLGEFQIDGQWTQLCDAHYDAWYGGQVRAGIDTFTAAGVPVVFLVPPPSTLPYAPASLNQAIGCLGDVERKLARQDPRVSTIDLNRFVCPKGECRNTVDGVNLRPDGLHFLGPGADITVRWLVPRIRQTLTRAALPVTAPPSTPAP